MADLRDELQSAFGKMIDRRNPAVVFPATVKSVDMAANEMDVEDLDGHEIFGVLLSANADVSGLKIEPKVGSAVMVAQVGKSPNRNICIGFSELEKVTIETATAKITVAPEGFKMERAGQDFGQLLSDFIDQIKLITVTTPAGPSTAPILNAAAFDLLKTRLGQIFS